MLHSFTGKVLLVRGLPAESEQLPPLKGVTIVDFLPAAALNIAIQSSEWVICRSGYSSVMDLLRLKHKAILVPTPGQTEQEYLATQLHDKGIFYTVKEELLSLENTYRKQGLFLLILPECLKTIIFLRSKLTICCMLSKRGQK